MIMQFCLIAKLQHNVIQSAKPWLGAMFMGLAMATIGCSGNQAIDPVSDSDKAKEALVGEWCGEETLSNGSDANEQVNADFYYSITRNQDQTYRINMVSIDHDRKEYFSSQEEGQWQLQGNRLITVSQEFPDDPLESEIVSMTPDEFQLRYPNDTLNEAEWVTGQETRTAPCEIPTNPAGYTDLS